MKMLMLGALVALGTLGVSAADVRAEETVLVDGVEYPLSILTANCQSMSDNPQAMIDCFNKLSALMEGKSADAQENTVPVAEALESLRAVAQFQNDDTGLSITGSECNIQVVYFGNYFHVSRRNVSTIDLFSAEFDAAQLQYDQITGVPGAQVPLSRGVMNVGAKATVRGGIGMDSAKSKFPSKSARQSMAEYAGEVVGHLPTTENQTFDFVLVHPARNNASTEIWDAFKVYVDACSATTPAWLTN